MRGGAVVARVAHNHQVAGSNPVPAPSPRGRLFRVVRCAVWLGVGHVGLVFGRWSAVARFAVSVANERLVLLSERG